MAEEISFVGGSQNCCVCFIDIVDSTRITTVEIADSEKIKIYYSMFINTMAAIVRNFDGTIIKNTGDSLIYYFPKTMGHVENDNVTNFKNVFECGLTMLAVHPIMNVKLKEKGLPDLSYRISADYGKVEVAKSLTSTSEDLFGSIVNLCSKINSKANPNQMVIGNDLYQITKSTLGNNEYHFNKADEYPIDSNSKNQYSVYSVFDKNQKNNDNRAKIYENIV
ncbi:MAG: adenylate/guanylate cyclase domain-containing protein [Thermoproteota archaeon]|nr:adenylate/guanylate cyclase domain-containing protein [Thermoproteota archaeon]